MRAYAFFLVGGLVLAAPSLAAAATLRVPKDHATIQAAVDAAAAGDRIVVKKGTYDEHVVVDGTTGLTIVGKGKPVIDGTETGTSLTIRNSSGVRLTGFVSVNSSRYGIHIDTCNDVRIQRCTVRNSRREGFKLDDSTHVQVKRCRVEAVHDHALELRRTSNSVVQGNRFDQSDDGISMWTGTGNRLIGNRISSCGEHGIALDGEDNTASGNTIRTVGMSGIMIRQNGNTVERNKITDAADFGISIQSDGNIVVKNVIKLAKDCGIKVQDGTGNHVEKCRVSKSANDGLLVLSTGNEFDKVKVKDSGGFDVRSTVPEPTNTWTKCKYKTSQFP